MRIPMADGRFRTPTGGIVLVMSGVALLGASFVLLFKSPFRMPPGERLFRVVWLGPVGRALVRFAGRGVVAGPGGRVRRATGSARAAIAPAVIAEPAPPARRAPVAALPSATHATLDQLAALEARVRELEREAHPRTGNTPARQHKN